LQEVQGRHDHNAAQYHAPEAHHHWPDQAQHEFLADDGHHVAYGMNAVYDHGHHGNALLSNFPIADTRNHDVSDHAYEQRGILHCVLKTPAGLVHCYVVHLGLFEGGRARQAEALIACVKASAAHGEPVIIAGDFNDWRNTLSDKLRSALGVCEVFDELGTGASLADLVRTMVGRGTAQRPARTFPAFAPWFRLDRIYVRGFKVTHAQVLHGTVWAKLSDHAPIVATLTLG
jgi:endonuclease/exonuclease/phosphatase family metal-dependent hydrolase